MRTSQTLVKRHAKGGNTHRHPDALRHKAAAADLFWHHDVSGPDDGVRFAAGAVDDACRDRLRRGDVCPFAQRYGQACCQDVDRGLPLQLHSHGGFPRSEAAEQLALSAVDGLGRAEWMEGFGGWPERGVLDHDLFGCEE